MKPSRHMLVFTAVLFLASPIYAFYQPIQGRWLSRDPIGEEGGVNTYGFAGNAPIVRVDAVGRVPEPGWLGTFSSPPQRCTEDIVGKNFDDTSTGRAQEAYVLSDPTFGGNPWKPWTRTVTCHATAKGALWRKRCARIEKWCERATLDCDEYPDHARPDEAGWEFKNDTGKREWREWKSIPGQTIPASSSPILIGILGHADAECLAWLAKLNKPFAAP